MESLKGCSARPNRDEQPHACAWSQLQISFFVPAPINQINGRCLSAQGEFEEADRLYSRVIEILGAPVREDHSNYVAALNRRAELYKEEVR